MVTAEGQLLVGLAVLWVWLWMLATRRRSATPQSTSQLLSAAGDGSRRGGGAAGPVGGAWRLGWWVGVAAVLFVVQAGLAEAILGVRALSGMDGAVWSWFVGHRRPDSTVIAAAVDLLGGTTAMAIVALLVVVVLLGRRRVAEAIVVATAPAVVGLLVVVDKAGYGRMRPPAAQQLIVETNGSLPSGHTAGTTVVLGVLAIVVCRSAIGGVARLVVSALAVAVAAVVGVSRLYLGVHWFSDVADGWLLGAALVAAGAAALAWWDRRCAAGGRPRVAGGFERRELEGSGRRGVGPAGWAHRLGWVAMVGVFAVPVASYGSALAFPGQASVAVRTVDWMRDNGAGGLVDAVETWWFAGNGPTGAAPAASDVPTFVAGGAGSTDGAGWHPAPLPGAGSSTGLPGEGVWARQARAADGQTTMFTSYFRPDPAHPSVLVGVAALNQAELRTTLVAGTKEPVAAGAPGRVPPALRGSLVAVFNSGWKMAEARGGYYADGQQVVALHEGAASVVVHRGGRASVGQWGRDERLGPDVIAVRQNLALVVDGGAVLPGVGANPDGRWGTAHNELQYTWRSGLGVDAAGQLIYLAGDQLTLAGLAQAMVEAGVVRGLELDIHPDMVAFNVFQPDRLRAGPTRLLPSMRSPPTRYLAPDQRDFFAVALADARRP